MRSTLSHYSLLRSSLALTMILVILTMNSGSAQLRNFLQDFRETISHQDSFCSADDGQQGYGVKDFKPPKQSFIDYGSFFGNSTSLPDYSPRIALLIFFEVFQAVPKYYPDVLVPPHPSQH
ncbi:MAG: hypothetical protein A2075_19515 [Geobacteraceae bacterium GWC2_58_44]|nr:MAG: hypothetical protein A2075_19515 [Geobacteraceae bacterium GWC2_58_44]HBG04756.1 hypothetical protein [Geobacter sp.]